jgi:hypothetical protein
MAYNNKKSPSPVTAGSKVVKEIKKDSSPKVKTTQKRVEGTITDVGSALSDIQKRADARKKLFDEGQSMLNESRRKARQKGATQTGSGKLQGLASLKNTLGMQYYKET